MTLPFPITVASRTNYVDTQLIDSLSYNECAYFDHISPHKREDWLMGRMASKCAIQGYVGTVTGSAIDLSCIEIISGTGLPPTFTLLSPVISLGDPTFLTLSHSHGIAVAQVCARRGIEGVGVDVERVRTFKETTLRAFLADEEYERWCIGSDSLPLHATLLWSIKEAYLKAIGVGLHMHPKRVVISLDTDDQGYTIIQVGGSSVRVQIYWTTIADFYIITNVII